MDTKVCLLVLLSLGSIYIDGHPVADSASDTLRARLGDTLTELEWLLDQLVNILSDLVDGVEQEASLLQNYHFRQILIQVIKRIDLILEHFENVGTAVLTPSVVYELQRIDCIRIRLANYISQSKKFNDSHCRMAGGHKPGAQPPHGDQIVPLLTQIVSILVKVTQQLDFITHMKDQLQPTAQPAATTVTSPPMWTKPGSTINWDDLISSFITSKPVTVPNNSVTQTQTPGIGTTQNWNDLISQVMEGMGGTLTPTTTNATPLQSSTSASTVWEDVMNDLIGQWTGSMSTRPPGSNMDVQQCVDSILSIIGTIQSQLPNGTLPSTSAYDI